MAVDLSSSVIGNDLSAELTPFSIAAWKVSKDKPRGTTDALEDFEAKNKSLFDRLSRAQKQEGVNAINQRYGAGTTDMGDLRRLLTRTALNWGAGRNIGESALLAFEQDVNEQTLYQVQVKVLLYYQHQHEKN